jgi:hypothetical protein
MSSENRSGAGTFAAMRTHPLAWSVVVAVLLLGACGGGDDATKAPEALGPNSTAVDPGPNSTTFDPGPNNTSGGPNTLDGTLQVTARCLTLQRPQGPLDLRFTDYKAKGDSLVDDAGTAIAHNGDHLAVAGHQRVDKGACGTRFDVESLVTVLPKG